LFAALKPAVFPHHLEVAVSRLSVQLGMGLIAPATSPSAALARRELQEQVREAVELLKEKDRQILWMRHQDQLSHQEIAAVLDLTENASMVRYARALKRFKDLWHRLHPE
jgi:RNA polymerase sigma factor (sigma-70 family)